MDIDIEITSDHILFFDLDGTLIDTDLANLLSYRKAIKSVKQIDYDIAYSPGKRFNRGVLKNSILNLSETEYKRIIQKKEKYYKEFLPETKLNERVASILLKYSQTNQTVLITNCRKDRALMTLNHFGLTDRYSHIFYREFNDNETKSNKYKNAISSLIISPTAVIVFENEEAEIADAIAAGIPHKNILSI